MSYTAHALPIPIFTRQTPQGATEKLTLDTVNAFAISPSGRYIAGTCLVVDGQKKYARYFVLRRKVGGGSVLAGVPNYVVEPHDDIPSGWYGLSGRGINDSRDIVGFFHQSATDVANGKIPMKKMGAYALPTPMFPSLVHGTAFGITNTQRAVGVFSSSETGFIAKPTPALQHGYVAIEHLPEVEPHAMNVHGDYVYVKDVDGVAKSFAYLNKENLHVDLTTDPIFTNAMRVVVNGLNNARQVVGFFATAGSTSNPKGTFGFIGVATEYGLATAMTYRHPDQKAVGGQTSLFGISSAGLIVGTYDAVNPFILRWASS